MSIISLRLPESLHNAVKKAAKKDNISINQLVSTAIAEKVSALLTEDYLIEKGKKAPDRKEYEKLLSKVPKVQPHKYDKL